MNPSKTLVQFTNLINLHCPLPLTVPEQVIHQFYWYFQGDLRVGMRLHHELYGFVAQFDSIDRTEAFELACILTSQGGYVVISVDSSSQFRRVWLNLRNWRMIEQLGPRCKAPSGSGDVVIDRAASLR